MDNTLHATLTRTGRGLALATVDGLPGGGADLTPSQLRALAAALIRIADDADSRQASNKHTLTRRREYRIE